MNRERDPRTISRRAALRWSLAGLLPGLVLQGRAQRQDSLAARLPWPGQVGRPRDRITDYENDPFIVGVEGRIRCTCGCNLDVHTCRTTDFTCQTSPAMHRAVVAMVEEGKTAEEILDAFVAQYGEMVLMAPKKEGFNWAAYVVPGFLITLVGGIMAWILMRRTSRMRRPAPVSVEADGEWGLAADETARLNAELERLER